MSVDNQPTQDTTIQERFRGRIQRTFLLVVIPLSMLPLIIIGSIVFFRARDLLIDQVHDQANIYLHTLANDIDTWITTARIKLDATLRQGYIREALDQILTLENTENSTFENTREVILSELKSLNQERVGINFSDFMVLSSSGEILISTQPAWEGFYLTDSAFSNIYSDNPGSYVGYALAPLSDDEIMVFTHIPYQAEDTNGYVVGILSNSQLLDILTSVTKFQPQAKSYIVLDDQVFLGLDYRIEELSVLLPSQSQINVLTPLGDQYTHSRQEAQQTPGSLEEHHKNISLRSFDGTPSLASYTWVAPIQAGVVIDIPESIVFENLQALTPYALISLTALVALLSLFLWIAARSLTRPLQILTETTRQFAAGDWSQRVPETRDDEIGALSYTFNQMAEELAELYQSLSSQVAEQTLELHERSTQLEATAQVAREAAVIHDLDTLLKDTTELISEHFGFYHAGIFLLDEGKKFAVLQAANSEGGQRMLKRGHKLGVGQTGVVGRVADTGLPRIALDVGDDRYYFDNPDMPETRSEMALPLKIHDRIIGVLDVQSKTSGAFTNEDAEVLQIMADQVTMAIENARLLEQSLRTVRELQTLYGEHVDEAWQQRLGGKPKTYHFDRVRVKPATDDQITSLEKSDDHQPKVHIDSEGYQHLLIPITLRGQSLGDLSLRRNPDEPEWTLDDQGLAKEVSTQIAVALENARLLEESQRRAAQEELLSQASARFSQSLDINTVLQMAVRELGQLAGVAEVSVQLTPEE